MSDPLLDIRDLTVDFEGRAGTVRALQGLSLSVPEGKTVALVGESGSGKTVAAMSVLRLIPQPPARVVSGQILFRDPRTKVTTDLLRLPSRELRKVRGARVAMVFQEPMTALNPVMTVGRQIAEVLELHRGLRGRDGRAEVVRLLDRVGIAEPSRRVDEYPHTFSGGMRQRVVLAMALAGAPALLIADEPTTALDVTIQKQILDLIRDVQRERGMTVLLITHDFAVVSALADGVYVLHEGRIREHGPTSHILRHPRDEYTQSLVTAARRLTGVPPG